MIHFSIDSGPLAVPFAQSCARLDQIGFADALWSKRLDVWTSDPETQQKISNRLGWLSAIEFVTPHIPRLQALAHTVGTEGFTDVVLLGMGGSSLAPEVLRQVLGVAPGYPRFSMLDSVDPDAVRAAMENADTSVFVLASKSGSTIEPNVMAAEARRRVLAAGHAQWGQRFIAITDEHSPLHRRAIAERFREIFVNPADIGGRFSALSFFGLVPAALMGADLHGLTDAAKQMERACRVQTAKDNPGLALGALMAAGAQNGRDKLTLLLPEELQSFGLWVEQLIAESTGKHGKGVVPIVGETVDSLGSDRLAVSVTVSRDAPDHPVIERVRAASVPLATLPMADITSIGAEFLRWEIATAAAGALMGINPFDEPNVQQAKDATRALLDVYTSQNRLPIPEPHAAMDGARLALSTAAEDALTGASPISFLQLLRPADYFALLAYLPPGEPEHSAALRQFRTAVGRATGCATMFGYGPRYLHSTGQLHKGGPNNGAFIVITAEPAPDLPIPGEPFSFGVLEMAQAIGDFQSLDRAGRRALHIHLPRRDPNLLQTVTAALITALTAPEPSHPRT
jgi:glucose-6-phosphate isomerase